MALADDIISGLKSSFRFKSQKGKWLQQGQCPQCGKWELFCSADQPRMVKCGRLNECGWEDTVRNQLSDLFEDWSKRAPATEADPNATADAYLSHERFLDLQLLRGSYSQETYHDRKKNLTTATVRFPLANGSWWERLIDRPGRFDKKARFRWIDPELAKTNPDEGRWGGHWWQGPTVSWEMLAAAEEIWLVEGIFDATALVQADIVAVSLMTVNNWPEDSLAELLRVIAEKNPKHRPRLVFAFDVGAAGVSYTRKFVRRARLEGWEATAAQVRPDGEGSKLDWNDLLIRHLDWKGDPDRAPFSRVMIDEYLWNGAVTIAESARDKAKLIHNHRGLSNFTFRFDNRTWAAKITYEGDDGDKRQRLDVDEIANCAFRILYMERDETLDETNFFLQIDFPEKHRQTVKARFSSNACAAGGEFKKRLMAFAGGWSGTPEQLDRLMRQQTKSIKIVEPLPFTGYSEPHGAWVFGDLAVRDGRLVKINSEKYFDFGKAAVKLRTPERILSINYNPDVRDFPWMKDLWGAWGVRGYATLAFFVMSLFAVQIRNRHDSLGFLEITGDPGSGKTTIITFMWKLLGRKKYEGFDPNKGSIAGVARNFVKVSNLPVGLIEGNRDTERTAHRRQFDWTELLTLFNGRSPRVTGARTGGAETVEPPFLGSIYLMQNQRIDSIPAVLERLMSFSINKEHWTDGSRAAARRIQQTPIDDLSGTVVHIVRNEKRWLDTFFKQVEYHEAAMPQRTKGLHNDRCILNHSQLVAALEATAEIMPMDEEAIGQTIRFIDAMALDRQQSCGGDHPLVQSFWETVDYLLDMEARMSPPPDDPINRSRKPDQFIAINLPALDRRVRNANLTPLKIDELKKLLRDSKRRKYVADKTVNAPNGIGSHCWIFEKSAPSQASKGE